MKVLFNAFSLPGEKYKTWGGPQVFTKQLTSFFKRNRVSFVGLLVKSRKSIPDGEFTVKKIGSGKESWIEFTTSFHVTDILQKGKISHLDRYTKTATELLTEIVRSAKPDVVFLSGFSILNWYLLHAAHNAKVPVIVSHHGLWFREISEFAPQPSKRLVSLIRSMEKDATRISAREIFLNRHSLREYEKNLIKVPAQKLAIIPISYNPLYKSGKRSGSRMRAKIKVGFVGRWSPVKNPEAVLALAKEAKKQKLPWEFYSVTRITKAKKLLKLRSPYRKNLRIIEHLEPKQLKAFYEKMDLLVLPSRIDVSPTVVIEAGLSRRGTVISPNVGWADAYRRFGMQDWISDFKNPAKTLGQLKLLLQKPVPEEFVKYLESAASPESVFSEHLKVFREAV